MIVGLGCVALDDVLITATTWAAGKGRVLSRAARLGGNARTALTVASGLGSECAYLGMLGSAPEWAFVTEDFRAHGVDVSFVEYADDVHPVLSTVTVTSDGERYIAFDDSVLQRTHLPGRATIDAALASASALLVDATTAPPETIDVLRRARAMGVPVVLDAERHNPDGTTVTDLLAVADHPVLPSSFAMDVTDAKDPRGAVEALWDLGHASVVVTDGVRGAYARDETIDGVLHVPAFPVMARNTNGCGDAFHGAYVVGLVEGAGLEDRVRFSSAAAAVVAARNLDETRVPSRGDVEAVLRGRAIP